MLAQHADKNQLRPIGYVSRTLNEAVRKYSVTHKEALAIVCGLKHFKAIVFGYQIPVSTDHRPCQELFKGSNVSGQLVY